ncbi:MAG: hypothetical protein HY905_08090 [Deltaproteobacteria bacterium]|nr:hypothetical protein [Deltaproteobacteria bacterium]
MVARTLCTMSRSGNLATVVFVLAVAVGLSAPAAAQEVLALSSSEVVPPEALVEALRLRVQGPVEYRPGSEPGGGVWVLTVGAVDDGAALELRSPDGRSWSRTASLAEQDETEWARAIALQAGYVALLAGAPFAVDDLPPPPAPPPVGGAEDEAALLLELGFGGSGDVWGEGSGEDASGDLLVRAGVAWRWGLWVELEAGWRRIPGGGAADYALDFVPVRLGIGGALAWEPWELRFALQATADYWRVTGDALHPSGWRGGAGLVLGGAYRVAPWCLVGLEAGLEFTPRALQLDYRGEPGATSGQVRWRAGVVVGFEAAGL